MRTKKYVSPHSDLDIVRGTLRGDALSRSTLALRLQAVSRTLASELSDVAVVTVDPGDMRTQMHQDAFPGEDITDRPLPDVTIPFWAWLFSADHGAIDGRRFQAQGESWEVAS